MENTTQTTKAVCEALENAGFDYAVAVTTKAEVEAGAACGQLSIITKDVDKAKEAV
jgi:adenine C2-methylase RlmN of 23S rRNA A2503 and tRNA A37